MLKWALKDTHQATVIAFSTGLGSVLLRKKHFHSFSFLPQSMFATLVSRKENLITFLYLFSCAYMGMCHTVQVEVKGHL